MKRTQAVSVAGLNKVDGRLRNRKGDLATPTTYASRGDPPDLPDLPERPPVGEDGVDPDLDRDSDTDTDQDKDSEVDTSPTSDTPTDQTPPRKP